MYFQKKKIIKLLMGVALVGLTLAVLCSSVFADPITSVPEGAIELTALRPNTFYYKISGITDWLAYDESIIESPNNSVYFRAYNRCEDPNEPIVENNYTYYYEYNIRMGVSNDDYDDYDALNFFLSTSQNPNAGSTLSIRGFDDFTITYSYSFPVNHISIAFRTDSTTDYSNYIRFVSEYIGTGRSQYRVYSYNVYRWYDIEGTIYNQLVMNSLDEIDSKLDTVNNNLVTIESSIDDMNTNVGNKLQQVQNKIDAAANQAHQDAQNQVDAIEDLPQQQYNYEHQQDQNAADEYIEEFSGGGGTWDQEIDSYIDIEGLQESIGNLYGAFINNQKSYTIIFPGSGNVPILNKTLWTQQTINLQPFATSTPGRIMIIACNGVFSLVGIIGLVVFIRRVLQDILHH